MREWISWLAALAAVANAANAADEPAFRYSAPITVTAPGPFVQLPLTPGAYGRSASAGLADLRVVDARGERVPFALLEPRRPEQVDQGTGQYVDLVPATDIGPDKPLRLHTGQLELHGQPGQRLVSPEVGGEPELLDTLLVVIVQQPHARPARRRCRPPRTHRHRQA